MESLSAALAISRKRPLFATQNPFVAPSPSLAPQKISDPNNQSASHVVPSLLRNIVAPDPTPSQTRPDSPEDEVKLLPPPLKKSPAASKGFASYSIFSKLVESSQGDARRGPPPLKKTVMVSGGAVASTPSPHLARIPDSSEASIEVQVAPPPPPPPLEKLFAGGEFRESTPQLRSLLQSNTSSESSHGVRSSPPPLTSEVEMSENAVVPVEKDLVSSLAAVETSGGQLSHSLHTITSAFNHLINDSGDWESSQTDDTAIPRTGDLVSTQASSHAGLSALDSGVTFSPTCVMSPCMSSKSSVACFPTGVTAPLKSGRTSSSSGIANVQTSSLCDWESFKPGPPPSLPPPSSLPPPPPLKKKTRSKYTLEQKMEVVNYAKTYSIYRACKHYKLSTGTIGPWTKLDFTKLKSKVYRKKKSGRRISYPPEKEAALIQWVLEQQDLHQELSIRSIMDKAMETIGESNPGFLASRGWAQKFMRRNDLVVQSSKKHLSHKLPAVLEAKISQFSTAVEDTLKSERFSLDAIINMDEVPMFFDSSTIPHGDPTQPTTSSDNATQETVCGEADSKSGSPSDASETKKKHVTVVLAATASGTILPMMVIFKGVQPPGDIRVPEGWLVCAQQDCWMDSDLMETWCQRVLLPYTNGQKSLLIMDSFAAHCGERVQDILTNGKVSVAHIPGGCTTKLQPLSVWLDPPFNTSCQEEFSTFCRSRLAGEAAEGGGAGGRGSDCVQESAILRYLEEGVEHLGSKPRLISAAFRVAGCMLEESCNPVRHTSSKSCDSVDHTSQEEVEVVELSDPSLADSDVLSEEEESVVSERQDDLQVCDQDLNFSYEDDDVYIISDPVSKVDCGYSNN